MYVNPCKFMTLVHHATMVDYRVKLCINNENDMCKTRKHSAPPFILNGKWFVMLPQYTLRQ